LRFTRLFDTNTFTNHDYAFDARATLTLKDVAISNDYLQRMVKNEHAQEGPFVK